MTVGTCSLVKSVNAAIETACDPLPILQLSGVAQDFDAVFVKSVANCAALPSAVDNKGRLIYLQDRCSYRWSDGETWSNDFASVPQEFVTWAWGFNCFGRLGDDTTTSRSSPVSVVGGFSDWCQISAGGFHSLAVRTNGSLWAWGNNSNGRLGDNTATNRSSPVSVVGGFSDWCQISAGRDHSLAIRTNGTAWAWGFNGNGQLGDNTITSRRSPVSVVGGFSDWCQISAGSTHSLAVRCNGTAWAWGANTGGRLGDNTVTSRSSPVSVVGGFSDWCQISAGVFHSLAVRTNGSAWAWGANTGGRLGDNTVTSRSSPVSVVGGFSDWCQISAGCDHSLAVRTNGSAWAWGANTGGRLGDNTVTSRSSPVSVVGGFSDWCQISAGVFHSLAVRTNGSAWAWGANTGGRLGDNTITDRSSPVSVVGGFSDWCQISAGCDHSLAIRSTRGFR
jgi:alpha-tubulin suppressor-like RCC1 family protein